ncbi:MAG TPA: hypothetical protein VEK73_20065 [Xanthobacteraceae bacterium]|nr:hypothetical protein [Xanthobacteraceae bacterium]
MTVNIGLITSDAVILGCDSVASTTSHFLDPFSNNVPWQKDEKGKFTRTKEGKYTLTFDFDDIQPVVTNAWGGITKLFEIHPSPTPMVAVTAGLAKLSERPIASWAAEFCAQHSARTRHLVNVEVIARSFLKFIREKYEKHYETSKLPEPLKEGPEFIVGGYGRDDHFPSLFRLDVHRNTILKHFGPGAGATGVAWNGQADAVERFIRGYDAILQRKISETIRTALGKHNLDTTQYITATINAVLDKLQAQMPDGINISVPELKEISLDWSEFAIDLDYANLPLQEAVNFVAFLVLLQDGKSRFARGVPTVGGRTHIGVITKDKGFRMLNEPDVTHTYTGFADDH